MPTIADQRLHHQQLTQTQFTQPHEVAAWLGALQGQDYGGAKWSLGLRLPGSTDADIERAIADKTIVRTWLLRGTLHLVAAADIRWLLELVAPRIIARCARRYRELELDAPTLARSNTLLLNALHGGKLGTRTELLAMLDHNGISTQGQRGVYMLQRASLDGLICQGVTHRNTATYMALDEALPPAKLLVRDEAVAELARRYFTSHGPATLHDFVWWSGLTMGDARAGIAANAAQLIQVTVAAQTYWKHEHLSHRREASPTVYLLPGFDEYLLGYADRSAVLAAEYATRIVPGGNGVFTPTIISDGRVVGTWKRTFRKGAMIIDPHPFTSLTTDEHHAFTVAAERYGAFLSMPVVLS